jgi:FkbM family methyltransferase
MPRVPDASAIRERLRRAARAAGVEPQAAAVYRRFDRTAARDHRDNEHLTAILAACLAADANCVDVGAHSGAVLRDIVRCAPAGRHIAFEPLPEFAAALAREFPSVDVHHAAVSDAPGEHDFTYVVSDPMQSRLIETGGASPMTGSARSLRVRTERLDDVLPDDYVPALIKVDVEGAEEAVFRGAAETLRTHRPILIFEHGVGGADRYGSGPNEVWDLLAADLGYRIYDLDGRGPYSRAEFEAVFTRPIWNFVARS